MKIFVLYDKSGIHSGRLLGSHLIQRLRGKATVHRGRPQRLEELQKRGNRYDYIINVGWFKDFTIKGATVLNSPKAISLSSNKKKARVRFAGSSVPSPKLWVRTSELQERHMPVIGRKTHHSKGKGFWFCNSLVDVRRASSKGATHFIKFIPNTREFRVHLMAPKTGLKEIKADDYRVVKLSEKIPNGRARRNEIIKNHQNGWFFGYPKNRNDSALGKVREAAKKAIKAFDLHWGAVDVMLSKDTGEPYVLEINSTPCLTDDSANTLEKYSNAMVIMLGIEPKPVKRKPPEKRSIPKLPESRSRKRLRRFLSNKRL